MGNLPLVSVKCRGKLGKSPFWYKTYWPVCLGIPFALQEMGLGSSIEIRNIVTFSVSVSATSISVYWQKSGIGPSLSTNLLWFHCLLVTTTPYWLIWTFWSTPYPYQHINIFHGLLNWVTCQVLNNNLISFWTWQISAQGVPILSCWQDKNFLFKATKGRRKLPSHVIRVTVMGTHW